MNRRWATVATRCLSKPPDPEALDDLGRLGERETKALLKWMDEGGLSLYLLNHLQSFGAQGKLTQAMHQGLVSRLEANRVRAQAMFSEFSRINELFYRCGVQFAFLKGFSLTPEFSPSIYVRHQMDIDILVPPTSVSLATTALRDAGYLLESKHPKGELTFVTSLSESLQQDHEIYGVPRFSRVELHQSPWEEREGISLGYPKELFQVIEEHRVLDVVFPGLSTQAMFMLQLLHSFRHFLSSWVRQSWLYEISYFINRNYSNEELWRDCTEFADTDQYASTACGLILSLCSQLFNVRLPDPLTKSFVSRLPDPIREWARICGERWTLSDSRGSKMNLMIQKRFARDTDFRNKHRSRFLLPVHGDSFAAIRKQMANPKGDMRSTTQHLLERSGFTPLH